MTASDRSDERAGVPELAGAQAEMRDAFFAHDAGLFVLDCNPGAGKSTVAAQIAAETLVRATDAGERAPERRLCFTSFARDDAASIAPDVDAALRAFAADENASVDLTAADARGLGRRLRRSDTVGTIDSVLRSVFARIAGEVGFEDSPDVGDDARLTDVRRDALAAVRADPNHEGRFDRLDAAYPGGDYTADLDGLLLAALAAARERRLTIDAFADRLRETIADAYPDGPPDDFAAVLRDVEAFADTETARETANAFDATARDAFVEADRACHQTWTDAVDDFAALLAAVEAAYDELTRERGVATHLDAAHWVAEYVTDDAHASAYRETLLERYRDRLDTVVVDEAQDVSVAQHDALAPFVSPESRVLLVGDRKQCIYAWRNARPALFERALDDGEYFGIEWPSHTTARAARTYRARPDIAAAADAVFSAVFANDARGNAGDLTIDYPNLVPDRDPTDAPAVHVSAFGSTEPPGTGGWASDEAAHLARYLAGALSDDTFADPDRPDGDPPGVTVLFHRRTHTDTFADALEAHGITVADATRYLFDHPLVRLAAAVIVWLVDPTDPERTRALFAADTVPDTLADHVADADWSLPDAAADATDLRDAHADFLAGLAALADRHARHATDAAPVVLGDVTKRLSLPADPLGLTGDPARAVAALDALHDHVADWAGDDDDTTLRELAARLERDIDTPRNGPDAPAPDAATADVVFRTVFGMKGDEDDVVVLADLGARLGFHGPHGDAFVASGPRLALAPPADVPDAPALDGFDAGVYTHPERDTPGPGDAPRRDAGLRWATDRRTSNRNLAGPPLLAAAAGDRRAERWRLLYVAATRARDHLVCSLPRDRGRARRRPRDYWMDALLDGLGLDAPLERGSYTVDAPPLDGEPRSFTVAVNDVTPVDRYDGRDSPPRPAAATPPLSLRTGWTPRYVNASTLHPLATDPDRYVIDHLRGNALHADRDPPADAIPLSFDGYGPDAVGTTAHAVLTTAVALGVPTDTLRDCTGSLADRLDDALDELALPAARREELRAYVADTLCPQFAATDTWTRLQESTAYVEEPLDAVLPVDGLAVETQNLADVASRDPQGSWHVDDLKIGLAPTDPATRARYDLQAAVYAHLLERQLDEPVTATVTRLGLDPASRPATPPIAPVDDWFARLAHLRQP